MASVENSLCCGSNLKEQCQNPQAQNDLFMPTQRSESLTEDSGDDCVSLSAPSLLLPIPPPFQMKFPAEDTTGGRAAVPTLCLVLLIPSSSSHGTRHKRQAACQRGCLPNHPLT